MHKGKLFPSPSKHSQITFFLLSHLEVSCDRADTATTEVVSSKILYIQFSLFISVSVFFLCVCCVSQNQAVGGPLLCQ